MRGSQARLLAAVTAVLGALLLVTLAARSQRADTLTPAPRQAQVTFVPVTAQPDTVEQTPADSPNSQPEDTPSWILWLMAALAVAPIAILLWFLSGLVWAPAVRRLRLRRRGPPAAAAPDVDDEVPARIAAAVDEGLRELDQGGPSEGVVASWVLLERAAADAGTHRSAPETPSELAARLIDRHHVSSAPLLRLAELYREARFSRHRLPEEARTEARAALEGLRAELAASPIGGRRPAAGPVGGRR